MRYMILLFLAAALGTACGTSARRSQAGFDGSFGSAWETLPAATSAFGCPGYTDYTPAGETGLIALNGTAAARFTPLGGWIDLATAPINFSCWPGAAWVGDSLYVLRDGSVYAYDTIGNAWSTPVPGGVADTDSAQMTHDDSGHVYALETDSPYRIVRFTVASNTVDYLDTGGFSGASVSEPRIAWDSRSQRLYVGPDFSGPRLFAFDPNVPGTTVELASVPAEGGGIGTGLGDPFCGDRSGHLYAIGDTGCSDSATVYQYDIASDVWNRLPDLPANHGCNGACTVSDDGFLYLSPGDSTILYRIALGKGAGGEIFR